MRVLVSAAVALATVACTPAAGPRTAVPDGIAIAQQVIAAERDFAARAERDGQWTAFRATATADARMFVPQPTNAQTWLQGRTDPPVSVRWQPHRVVVSCDGTLAATTGAAQWPGGSHGYFTTIWQRQNDASWRWIADFGERLGEPLANVMTPIVELAACPGAEGPQLEGDDLLMRRDPSFVGGASTDRTLLWHWDMQGDVQGLGVSVWIGPRYAATITPGAPAVSPPR